jgi:hypothetical protein
MSRLRDRVDELERQIEAAAAAVEAERRALAELEREVAVAGEILGDDERAIELGLRPLIAALVASLAALTATMLGYVQLVAIVKGDWTAYWLVGTALVVALAIAGGASLLARRPGAGGSARVLLRRATVVAIAFGLLLAAVATVVYLSPASRSHDGEVGRLAAPTGHGGHRR